MSALCAFLTEGCYLFYYFRLSGFWEPVIYFYCSSIQSLFAPIIIIKKNLIHHSNFSCGTPDTCCIYTNYFYMWWIEHEHFYIFQNALAAVCVRRILTMWAITCQRSCECRRQLWSASGVRTLRMTKGREGQPDGQHQHTSCLNQPPLQGPVSCFQWGGGSLWYCVDCNWQTQCFGLIPFRNAIKQSGWQQSGVGVGGICLRGPDY